MKKKQLLELQLAELQAIRTYLEQLFSSSSTTSTNYVTVSTSGFGGGGGNWNPESGDPALDRLTELLNNPTGDEAKYVEDVPEADIPEGSSLTEQIQNALQQHDQDLLQRIRLQ